VQQFAGAVSRNKPLSGEVVGDNIMDLYFKCLHQIYAAESHAYKKDVPRDFSKCMQAYHFLSVHPRFEVEIPMDGNKPTPKNPNSLIARDSADPVPVDNGVTASNQSFVARPVKKTQPTGREASK
jgi:hypothetical protein